MDEKNNGVDKASRLYSTHGRKKFFGVPVIVNGRRALGYFEGETWLSKEYGLGCWIYVYLITFMCYSRK